MYRNAETTGREDFTCMYVPNVGAIMGHKIKEIPSTGFNKLETIMN